MSGSLVLKTLGSFVIVFKWTYDYSSCRPWFLNMLTGASEFCRLPKGETGSSSVLIMLALIEKFLGLRSVMNYCRVVRPLFIIRLEPTFLVFCGV